MARDQNQASEKGTPEPGGYATLAKRMTAWTTNSLLTLMVLVVGIGFGRQVLTWWAEDNAQPADVFPQMIDGLGHPGRPHLMEFGGLTWSLRRQAIKCDLSQVGQALRFSCREVVCRDTLPTTLPTTAIEPSEAKFLAQLAKREPVEQQPGEWQLYELEGAFPLVVGTRLFPAAEGSPSKTNLANPTRRVVTWGVAVPMGPEAWTLYTFQPGGTSGEGFPELPEFPLPPECSKTLSLRVAGGGGMIGFEGPEPAESWTRVYDDWFAERGWKTAGWQRADSTWLVRYNAPAGGPISSVDVRFGVEENGQTRGLLILTARNVNPKESEDR